MRNSATFVLGLIAVSLTAITTAQGQYYLAGDFNGWNSTANPLVDNGNGSFSLTIAGTPSANIQWQVVTADWSFKAPGDSGLTVFNAAGQFSVNYFPGPFADGRSPTANRAGFQDPGLFGYEIMGDFSGNWATPVAMSSLGNGVYSATYSIASAGAHEFKFRKAGDWGISLGDDFSNWNHNCTVATALDNQEVQFQLDLPNGRWQAVPVPEPSALGFLTCGALAFILRSRFKG